ncbi:MAG: SDR family oxidoreductase [Kiritimatiellae bacterium]|nr:SDR family oxidoreductase [Kiritimatiellia bacterium]
MAPAFQNQVAVVTGAGGMLCSAIAKHLASLGCKVVLIGRTREKLEKVASNLAVSGAAQNPGVAVSGSFLIEPGDVTDEAAMQAIADRVLAKWGPCRFLVNGAGGNDPAAIPTRLRFTPADLAPSGASASAPCSRGPDSSGPRAQPAPSGPRAAAPAAARGFWDIDMAAFRRVLEINTLGTVIPSRIFGLQMARAGGGAILNFASMNTYRPLTRVAPYAMAKAAIANWTQFFAQYMAPAHVRVNAVAPGFMVNERSRKYLCTPDGGLSPRGEQVMAHTPMGRFGEAEDLLGCVEWLLDDTRAAFVTGITIPVDGGFLSSAGV